MKYVYTGELERLKEFGYQEGKDVLCCSYSAYGKIYEQQLDKILNVNIKDAIYVVEINKHSKEVE